MGRFTMVDWRACSVDEVRELARKAGEWVASGEGRKVVETAKQHAEEATSQLSRERILDPHILRKPLNL